MLHGDTGQMKSLYELVADWVSVTLLSRRQNAAEEIFISKKMLEMLLTYKAHRKAAKT